jgi:hypothetical protein
MRYAIAHQSKASHATMKPSVARFSTVNRVALHLDEPEDPTFMGVTVLGPPFSRLSSGWPAARAPKKKPLCGGFL